MSEDNKSGATNANSLNPTFNRDNKLAHDIAKLSPAGQQLCKKVSTVSAERMEEEKKNQQRSHNFRIMKTKVELMEKYVLDQSDRPPEIKADPSADLKIIHEQAERMVKEKEEFYLRNIEREAEANLRKIVAMELGGHDFSKEMSEHELGG